MEEENSVPVASNDHGFTVATDSELTILSADLLENDTDADGDDLTITTLHNAFNCVVTINEEGNIDFRPAIEFSGIARFSYTVTDNNGGTSTAFAAVKVGNTNTEPLLLNQIEDQNVGADEDVNFTIPANTFVDLEGDDLTYSAGSAFILLSDDSAARDLPELSPLPEWLTFNAGTQTFSGTPPENFDGFVAVEVRASDGVHEVSTFFSFDIVSGNSAPVLVNELANQSSDEDTAVSFAIPADAFNDPDGDDLSYTAGLVFLPQDERVSDERAFAFSIPLSPLPDWLTFNASNLTFSGTPPQDYYGVLNVGVTASDGSLETSATFRLVISAVNDAPIVANELADQTSAEDTAISFTIPENAFSDVDNFNLTLSAQQSIDGGSPLPDWLTFNAANRTFSGTPPQDFFGLLELVVTASDGELTVSDTFHLDITGVNDGPELDNPLADQSFNEDTEVSFTIPGDAFSDVEGTPLTYTAGLTELPPSNTASDAVSAALTSINPLPDWLTFNASTRSFTGTPPQNYNGSLDITVIASDGELEAVDTFILNIASVNDGPDGIDDEGFEATAGTTLTIAAADLLENDTDVEGDQLSIVSVDTFSGNGQVSLNDNGDVVYTPREGFTGEDGFVYIVSDGNGGEDTVAVSLTVVSDNNAPVLDNELADQTSEEDTAVSFTIPANAFSDPDGDDLSYTATLAEPLIAVRALTERAGAPLPAWLVFNAATRTFTGTPPQDFFGSLDVTVTASDGDLEVSDTFTLVITSVNDGPVAVDDTDIEADAGVEQIILAADLLANDSDVEGDDLNIVAVSSTSGNATVSLNAEGNVVYTASEGFDGDDSFIYTVSDGNGGIARATVSLSVDGNEPNPYEGWQIGTEGRDVIYGDWNTSNRIYGNDGDDKLVGGSKSDQIDGGKGNDAINGRWGDDIINGNEGNDRIWGSSGNDTLSGGEGRDMISGGWGDDTINGDAGNDSLHGNSGNDTINGGDGNDRITGSWGNDIISGGEGVDTVSGGTGNDLINGDAGNDKLYGNSGNDTINGGDGNDRITGSWGNDIISGGEGVDTVSGGTGNDLINGDAGNDRLYGNSGNDTINGGAGNDTITGSWGNDTLSGGEGNDQLWGGWGQDTFVFNTGDGADTVRDFSTGYNWWWFRVAGDIISLDVDGIENYDDLMDVASQEGRHTKFDFGDDDSLTLNYTRLSSLDQDDFSFV